MSWPGSTRDLIVKKLPPILAKAKGRLNQEKQNLQSTKNKSMYEDQIKKIRNNIKKMNKNLPRGTSFQAAFEQDIFNNAFPQLEENNKKTYEVIYKVFVTSSATGVTYID